jgi:hypothetical protein
MRWHGKSVHRGMEEWQPAVWGHYNAQQLNLGCISTAKVVEWTPRFWSCWSGVGSKWAQAYSKLWPWGVGFDSMLQEGLWEAGRRPSRFWFRFLSFRTVVHFKLLWTYRIVTHPPCLNSPLQCWGSNPGPARLVSAVPLSSPGLTGPNFTFSCVCFLSPSCFNIKCSIFNNTNNILY